MKNFEKTARSAADRGIAGELWYFLSTSKKWWLLPILVVVLGIGMLIFLSGTAAAPFIYTLF